MPSKTTPTSSTSSESASAVTDKDAPTAPASQDYLTQEEFRAARRRDRLRDIAAQLLAGLMMRDGATKTPPTQAATAITYAEELLRQLEQPAGREDY